MPLPLFFSRLAAEEAKLDPGCCQLAKPHCGSFSSRSPASRTSSLLAASHFILIRLVNICLLTYMFKPSQAEDFHSRCLESSRASLDFLLLLRFKTICKLNSHRWQNDSSQNRRRRFSDTVQKVMLKAHCLRHVHCWKRRQRICVSYKTTINVRVKVNNWRLCRGKLLIGADFLHCRLSTCNFKSNFRLPCDTFLL